MRGAFVLAAFVLAAAPAAGEPPRRIAVAGSGLTEIVYALGAADRLVAVDTTSLFPAARRLPQLGYLRALGAEGIVSVRPDLVLAAEEAGPPAAMAQLALTGIPVVRAGDGYDAAAVLARVSVVGKALGLDAAAGMLADTLRADFDRLAAEVASLPRPRVVFILSAGGGAPMASGRETAAASIIELAGATNAVDAYRGYKPLSAEALAAMRPDAILTTDQTIQSAGGIEAFRRWPQLAGIGRAKIVAFDAVYLLGFGPRTAHAAQALARELHPGAKFAPLPERVWLNDSP